MGKYAVITSSVAPAAQAAVVYTASWVLLRLVLVDVGDFEVWGSLNGLETRSERGYSTRVLLSTIVVSVLGRGVANVLPRPSPGCATS
jgi:hypothetical protein